MLLYTLAALAAVCLATVEGQNLISLYPYTYEFRLTGTALCLSKALDGVAFANCTEGENKIPQRWQLSTTGLVTTTEEPYQCLSAGEADANMLYLTYCNPASLRQRWSVGGSRQYPMPILANTPLNLCAVPCQENALKACAYGPADLSPGQCRTSPDALYDGFLTGRIAGGKAVVAVMTSTQSSMTVATATQLVTATFISTETSTAIQIVGRATSTFWETVTGNQPTYTVVVVPIENTEEGNLTLPAQLAQWSGGSNTTTVIVVTVAVAAACLLVFLAWACCCYGRKYNKRAAFVKTPPKRPLSVSEVRTVPSAVAQTKTSKEEPGQADQSEDIKPAGRTSIFLECMHADLDDIIVMVGDRESLGNWEPHNAPAMTRHPDNPHLFVLVIVNVLSEIFEYKFAKISGADGSVTWMGGNNLVLQPAATDIAQAYVWEI